MTLEMRMRAINTVINTWDFFMLYGRESKHIKITLTTFFLWERKKVVSKKRNQNVVSIKET